MHLILFFTRGISLKGWDDFKKGKIVKVHRHKKRRRVKYDIKLTCFKSKYWIGNGQLITAGPMREKISSLKRFDAVEFGLGNLHVVDYSLFWGSIRKNVKLRLNEYLKKQN